MPLIKSGSDKAVGKNIGEMVKAGHPRDQAIAASLNNQRRAKSQGFNKGGSVCATPSVEQSFENNIAETAANPTTGATKLAKGGPAKPSWRRW